MNAMTHSAHPELIARPFAAWPAHIPLPQDAIRERMMSLSGPKPMTIKEVSARGPTSQQEKRAAERAAMTPEVLKFRDMGLSQVKIAAKMNVSAERIGKILKEAGRFDKHQNHSTAAERLRASAADYRRQYQDRVMALYSSGLSRSEISRRLGIGIAIVRRIVSENGGTA